MQLCLHCLKIITVHLSIKSIHRHSSIIRMMKLKHKAVWDLVPLLLFVMIAFAADEPHPCDRICIKGDWPRKCVFHWTLEHHVSLNLDCGRCPFKIKDCYREGCIPVNGVERQITVLNRQMPGPSITVCKGDEVVVNIHNEAGAEVTTIHWHGINQVGTPYMDGVPFVTQCPIHPFTSFQYTFIAKDVGTYFYHSHVAFQRTDGVNGMLVVRQPREDDPNRDLYDFDLSRHQIMLSDWINKTGEEMFRRFYHSNLDYGDFLTTILVNGRGRLRPFQKGTTGKVHYTPYSSFVVKQGFRYRFRICSNVNWICPIEVSVVGHDLLVVGTDGDSVVPIKVNAVVVNPGERFDVVINANKPITTYWMLFRGLLRCRAMNTVGRAILKYENAVDVEPPEPILTPPSLVLNPINDPFTSSSQISLFQLQSYTPADKTTSRANPDKKFFLPFNLYPNVNPFVPSVNALLPMVDCTAFLAPPSPLLSQFHEIPEEVLCTENRGTRNCSTKFFQCTYILKVKLGWVVEVFLIDIGPTRQSVNHPWHLHGHHFRVIGGSFMNTNNTVAYIKALDKAGKIKRNLNRPVLKDTVSVPHGGYTVIRFHATNPGFWAFHCHVELHTETGMMLVFQVGDFEMYPPVPEHFPRCGNFQKSNHPIEYGVLDSY